MNKHLSRYLPQPFVAMCVSALALTILLAPWWHPEQPQPALGLERGCLAALLSITIIAASLYPIHIRRNIKVFLTTMPLYVAAMILPPWAAALTAGVSIVGAQVLTRAQRGNLPSDIATAAGRWVITGFVSAWAAQQLLAAQAPVLVSLLAGALAMCVCDIITGALEIAPMSGESPARILLALLREVGLAETTQYLLGILATLAALQQLWSLLLWVLPIWIVHHSFKNAKEMHDGTGKLLESMADAVDLRDPYTGGHSRRVTEYTAQILREMGVKGPEAELIRSAARVHDIGKIGIPDQILNKPGRLTPEEKQIMDSHAERGAELLARYQDFARGIDIVRHHHESWDGTGYPAGLKGLDIPFGARVIAVADSFDAMTSDRPYRAGMPVAKAARILEEGRGQQWEPEIIDAFLRYVERQGQPQTAAELTFTVAAGAALPAV